VTLVSKVKREKWVNEVPEEPGVWLDLQVWKAREGDLVEMERGVSQGLLETRENQVFKASQDWLDPKVTEATREIQDRKEMMDPGV